MEWDRLDGVVMLQAEQGCQLGSRVSPRRINETPRSSYCLEMDLIEGDAVGAFSRVCP